MNQPKINNPKVTEDLESSLADLKATKDQDTSSTFLSRMEKTTEHLYGQTMGLPDPVAHWMSKLPSNVTVGLIDAAVNTASLVGSMGRKIAETTSGLGVSGSPYEAPTAGVAADYLSGNSEAKTPAQAPANQPEVQAEVPPVFTAAKDAVLNFRDYMAQGSETSDAITQSIAQYAIPFMGYSKLIGGLHGATKLATIGRVAAAESMTAGTVLAPHDARAADLLQLGKHVEGKFGDAMNTIAPDGSLMNTYIDYMTNRIDEGEAEGRFKNIVDNLALSAAASSLMKTTAVVLKGGYRTTKYALENFGTGPMPGSKAAQGGHLSYHVTPHEFDQFDLSKMGTGEGNQSFGYGAYFAESPDTAAQYVKNFWDTKGKANVLQVHIPDDVVGKMLKWDVPLAEQPDVLRSLKIDPNQLAQFARQPYGEITGQQLYTAMSRGQTNLGVGMSKEAASKFLNDAGIPGIKYLDQGSRDAGAGTHNIVLFDAKHANIMKKNGEHVMPAGSDSKLRQASANASKFAGQAPESGLGIVKTGDKEWTIFSDRKPQSRYTSEAAAQKEFDTMNEAIFAGKNVDPGVTPTPNMPEKPAGIVQKQIMQEVTGGRK